METEPMPFPLCATCGTQYETREAAPTHCLICEDDRQYVGWSGQQWLTMEELAARHTARLEIDDGLLGIGTSPSFAINQRALVLPTRHKRVMWECTSLVTPAAVAALTAQGGIDLIAISHPHFYAAMVAWSEALGGVPIYLHEADRAWIGRTSPNIVLWRGNEHEIAKGVRLIRCEGHFPGSTALHWQDERRPKGALLPGDALQVTADRRHVTFMYSYPNAIPLHPDAVRTMRDRLRPYAFDDVYGFTWNRNIIGNARAAVDRSFTRYLQAIGASEKAA
jgi:glyoxylase-like metal-dependent hydrolase (beta-lactamase superfamily II)